MLLLYCCLLHITFTLQKMSSESHEYKVEKILDVRVNERTEEFLIKWKDYDMHNISHS